MSSFFYAAGLCEEQSYDTLDDFPVDIKVLRGVLLQTLKDAVGFVISGKSTVSAPAGHWGRSCQFLSGEDLQIRISPRGCVGVPLAAGELRKIAIRRTSSKQPTIVSCCILFRDIPESNIVALRRVPILEPSVFSKHHSKRVESHVDTQITPDGFLAIKSYPREIFVNLLYWGSAKPPNTMLPLPI